MEMVLRCVSMDLIESCGRCNCSWRIWSVGICVVPLALAIIIMIGGTFQPLLRISFRRGVYFVVLHCILSVANRSLVYVNSMNCILIWGSRWSGGVPICGILWMQSISGLKPML